VRGCVGSHRTRNVSSAAPARGASAAPPAGRATHSAGRHDDGRADGDDGFKEGDHPTPVNADAEGRGRSVHARLVSLRLPSPSDGGGLAASTAPLLLTGEQQTGRARQTGHARQMRGAETTHRA